VTYVNGWWLVVVDADDGSESASCGGYAFVTGLAMLIVDVGRDNGVHIVCGVHIFTLLPQRPAGGPAVTVSGTVTAVAIAV
jgi:hypothetical protein